VTTSPYTTIGHMFFSASTHVRQVTSSVEWNISRNNN